jgi:hypothetical protein
MAKQIYKPGQKTPFSGQYPIIGPRGGNTGDEVTSIKGRPLPPRRSPATDTASLTRRSSRQHHEQGLGIHSRPLPFPRPEFGGAIVGPLARSVQSEVTLARLHDPR